LTSGEDRNSRSAFEIDQHGGAGSLREVLNLALMEIRSGSREADLFYLAARAAADLGDCSKAEQLLRHLLALDPEHLNGWVLFGRIYKQKGDLARSKYGMKRAEELFPALTEFDLLGDIKLPDLPRPSKQATGDSGEVFETETYADICVKQGYLNKALKIYSDLKTRFPDNEGLSMKIDDVKKKMGRHD
jgi:tetratricopeptide (TPR) repeat protein